MGGRKVKDCDNSVASSPRLVTVCYTVTSHWAKPSQELFVERSRDVRLKGNRGTQNELKYMTRNLCLHRTRRIY